MDKLSQTKKLGKSGQSIEGVPESLLNKDIPQLGKITFTEQEWGRFAFMDEYGNMDTTVSIEEITDHIISLRKRFQEENSADFFNEQRDIILHTVVDRFALGGLMAKGDKHGGNVDTVHNVREGVYATEGEQNRYNNTPAYDSHEYHSDSRYINKNRQGTEAQDAGKLKDEYTGNRMTSKEQKNLDHIKAAKVIHDDPGRVLAELDGIELANSDDNFAFTNEYINKAKKIMSAEDFAKKLDDTREERRSRINELSGKKDLSDQEKKELSKLEKLESVNTDELRKRGADAEKKYNKKVNRAYYTSKKFIRNTTVTSLEEGAKIGGRQMVSLFISELIKAIFDEIKDYCMHAKKLGEKWYKGLSIRLKRIGGKIASKWKEYLEAGKDGFISAFCSNIVTVIINIFFTTAKNIVRLIREGFFSLLRAVKLLINPPPDMKKNQLFHEVGKLIISGLLLSLSILAEEAIDKFPLMMVIKKIPVIGEILSSVLFGLLTAIVTSLALWGWDKIDLFSYKKEKQHKFVMEALEKDRQEDRKKHDEWLEIIKLENPDRYEYLKVELSWG